MRPTLYHGKRKPPCAEMLATQGGSSRAGFSQKSTLVLVVVFVIIVFLLLFNLQDRLALRQAGIEIMLGNFLMNQVLVAIDAGSAFALHLCMCSLG